MGKTTKVSVPKDVIRIKGAHQNNLKNLNLDIPLNTITVITGVSGSGKSSLAFDTLYAEGQRRYVETFSPYARQFMERMDRPEVDSIEGIPPAIAIDNRASVRTSRSTVGTMTEITDYVKLLYTRLAKLHCGKCGKPVIPETPEHVWEVLKDIPDGTGVVITFPFSLKSDSHEQVRRELGRIGLDRFFIDGQIRPIEEWKPGNGRIHIVVDRLLMRHSDRKRIFDSLEQAFRFGGGQLDLWIRPEEHLSFSNKLECAECKIAYRRPIPNLFSFNSPIGACETCRGFGRIIDIDLDLVIPDTSLSVEQGAIKPWGDWSKGHMEFEDLLEFCKGNGIPTAIPFDDLTEAQKSLIIEGNEEFYGVRGFFRWLETKKYKMHVRVFLSRYRTYKVCPDCHGTRFIKEALLYHIGGLSIGQVYSLSIEQARSFFESVDVPSGDDASALILDEIKSRLAYLLDVGLGYLTLDRQSRTLSSGELQRVALTSALGSSLVNSLYILDEPSVGLHPRDNNRLIKIMKRLRDIQNTVIVVEHDPEIIGESDFMLDLGPAAGDHGGQIMYFGPTASVNGSLTGQYLKGQRYIPTPERRRKPLKDLRLTIEGASEHNLKDIDVEIPFRLFLCLTGVSGSGKSTLAEEILYKAIKKAKDDPQGIPGRHRAVRGLEQITDVVMIDQKPIGKTPRANPLTYVNAMDPIRRLLASSYKAISKGYGPGYFSFNVAGGRCETCKGQGSEKVEMQFLSDIFTTCPECQGKRFKKEALEITYKDKNIYEILSMTVDQAIRFFDNQPKIKAPLKSLADVGLGYIRLGQPINTLSGGEAQRLKLSRYLKSSDRGPILFILDEPTTGLHFADIERLISILQRLVDQGNTVLVIEHNMDVVKSADWVIDLGPDGGDAGGQVVLAGNPEDIARYPGSHTGRFLKKYLDGPTRISPGRTFLETPSKPIVTLPGAISITGAREHNLKNLSLSIPRQQFVVLTGVSGSGKSTLAFDILFAEGQRRYLESLAPYARQYVKVLERPEIDVLSGLPPTVAVQQRIYYASPRSTVATLTEVYHFLRLLFSKLGTQQCPKCGRQMVAQSKEAIVERVRDSYSGKNATILVSVVAGRKGFHRDLLTQATRRGYRQARIDGKLVQLREGMSLSRYREHTIEPVIGEIPCPDLDQLVSQALSEGSGTFTVLDRYGQEEILSLKKVCPLCGIGARELDPRLFSFNSRHGACPTCEGLGIIGDNGDGSPICYRCGGSRLKPDALAVKVKGYSIWHLVQHPADELQDILRVLSFTDQEALIARPIIDEILTRLSFMNRLGVSYLSLSRSGETLSGGEAQRVRLAAQLGSNLTGVCYILDEPTIGLHPKDTRMLLDALKDLKARGNSILVVEHDEETIREADHIIDLGPGAGRKGGQLVASGGIGDLKKAPESVTGLSLDGGRRRITSRLRPYKAFPHISVLGAVEHNLKEIDVQFPLGTLICITGVSGSGKSTLLKDVLYKGLQNQLLKKEGMTGSCGAVEGWEPVSRVLEVDHSPIGLTTRSVPISYIGSLSEIRTLFSMTPAARARGYQPGRFSFNIPGGRCEACKGHGSIKVEMSFLPDVYINCEVCGGNRFNRETLDISYKGQNMGEVLGLTFEEAVTFFSAVPRIRRALQVVCDIGLGYLTLGQPSPTLSGGEAQRIKICKELARPPKGHTFYILDEPTTGLHIADISTLIRVLQALVDKGNTVAVIEHNMEIIKEADYIIDLGPDGGEKGGHVVATGSPVEILRNGKKSYTAEYLRRYLNNPMS
jgi:excinuclease ABC subunit A